MRYISAPLRKDYDRWASKLPNAHPDAPLWSVSYDEALCAHYLICDFFFGEGEPISQAGPRNLNLFLSAVDRQFVSFGGKSRWSRPSELAATLFYGLNKNHPFHDGNKRTALLSALFLLDKAGRIPTCSQDDLEELAVRTAANELPAYDNYHHYAVAEGGRDRPDARVRFIAKFFRKYSRQIDRRQYQITFRELNTTLRRFGFELQNPSGNYIDIVQMHTRRRMFKKVIESEKIGRTGFPGWKKQVSAGDLRRIQKATGLTAERGYDSQVFYRGAEPLQSLINKYQNVLRRLRDL